MPSDTVPRAATGRMSRLARMLAGRNPLRRPIDRFEGAVLVALLAVFGVAVALAAIVATHTYQSQQAVASLRPAVAVLVQHGPPADSLSGAGQVEARWRVPGGGERSGVLTAATVPGISGAAAGTRVAVWLNRSGQPAGPPPGLAVMIIYALVTGGAVTAVAGVALLVAYALARYVLDRRRLAGWETAWARTGPSWTVQR
jgi:hypothetical protein